MRSTPTAACSRLTRPSASSSATTARAPPRRGGRELTLGAQMEPTHPFIKSFKAIICAYRGDLEGAMRTMTEVLRRNPDMDGVRPLYAQFLIQWGDLERARAEMTEGALRVARANFDVAYWVASAYAMLGDRD